ncbi:EAL domain-containing protein [Achromobacter seleniivolatilans]|uniref:cyclic-guanylate-specific phosphodiesterase n=1 Tax=Achromobacter seleniivolatilans TaxID=3047478 RepID=A0ABY9M579_9BURK|nr:EAL domain-containing protein [Achromobacter sp. R39]WMD22149.1 EAL domain-containing protein [Achromobacter sp. R39]
MRGSKLYSKGASRAVVVGLVLIAPVVGWLAGTAVDDFREGQRLAEYAVPLRNLAVDVARESGRILGLPVAPEGPCSDEDLDQLRRVVFAGRHVADAGRIKAGQIVCTAVWGRDVGTATVPSGAHQSQSGIHFWRQVANPARLGLLSDIAATNDSIVFTSPSAFAAYSSGRTDIQSFVSNREGTYVYQSFVPSGTEDGAARLNEVYAPSLRICSEDSRIGVCVEAYRLGFYQYAAWTLMVVGLILGAALACAFLLMRRHYRRSIPGGLLYAMEHNEIKINYQPIRELHSGRIVGAEALSRWTHPDLGPVSPPTFFNWAETLGLGRELTRYVVRTVLAESGEAMRKYDGFYIAINVAPPDLEDGTFLEYLLAQASQFSVPPNRIALEIIETSDFSKGNPVELLASLRGQGFKVFIDDFGCGYANLSHLAQWPIDAIKIDRSFVDIQNGGLPSVQILEQIIQLGDCLGLQLVVEGIESADQIEFLLNQSGSIRGQGWLLGRPMPVRDFLNLVCAESMSVLRHAA